MNKSVSIINMNETGILSHQTLRIWLISVCYVNNSWPYSSILLSHSHAQMYYVIAEYYYMYSIEVAFGTKEKGCNKIQYY